MSEWRTRMGVLLDRKDLGPFRLGFLEALVRMADWRGSANGEVAVARERGEKGSMRG